MVEDDLIATCSNRPRPSVQKGAKGHQHWRRDVYHLRHSDGARTLCGRETDDWLTIPGLSQQDMLGVDLCDRCRATLNKEG